MTGKWGVSTEQSWTVSGDFEGCFHPSLSLFVLLTHLTSLVSGNPAQESVSLMLPRNVVEGSVRATVSVTGKEFSYDNTFPNPISLSLALGKPKSRTLHTLSEVPEASLPCSSYVCGCVSWFQIT